MKPIAQQKSLTDSFHVTGKAAGQTHPQNQKSVKATKLSNGRRTTQSMSIMQLDKQQQETGSVAVGGLVGMPQEHFEATWKPLSISANNN